jgi:hypothetical protein
MVHCATTEKRVIFKFDEMNAVYIVMGGIRNAEQLLARKPEVQRTLRRIKRIGENNTKVYIKIK